MTTRKRIRSTSRGGGGTVTEVIYVEVPVGDGARDVSYIDSIDFGDKLAGTLGPVQTQDTVEILDAPFQSLGNFVDTIRVSATNTLEALSASARDSIQVSDKLQQVRQFVGENILATDDPVVGPVLLQDSLATTSSVENFNLIATPVDTITTSDARTAGQITTLQEDSTTVGDELPEVTNIVSESISVATARQDMVITTATLWPNTVDSNTGFTSPNNWIDVSEATLVTLSATQSGGLGGSSQTTNGTLVVDCGSVTFTPAATISNATIEWQWQTSTPTALVQTGMSVNVSLAYSDDNGSSWTTLETITTPDASAVNSTIVAITSGQLNQLKFRATGSVASGTIAILGGATQNFQTGYIRIVFDALQTL